MHRKNTEEVEGAIDVQIYAAEKSICRIRIIHGCNGGTRARSILRGGYGYDREPVARRIEIGDNQDITELVLKEFRIYEKQRF